MTEETVETSIAPEAESDTLDLKAVGIKDKGVFDGEVVRVPLDELTKQIGPPPSPSLLRSVKALGVVTPIVVTRDSGGKYLIVDGIRRVIASRAAGHETILARLIEANETERALLVLTSNQHRSENPHAEGKALSTLIGKDDSDDAVRAVAKAISVDYRKAGGILKTYRNLIPTAKTAIRTGKLPSYLAKGFALLSEAGQERLLAGGEVTAASIVGERKKARKEKKEIAVVVQLRKVAKLAAAEGRNGLARTLSDIADEVMADKEKYKAVKKEVSE